MTLEKEKVPVRATWEEDGFTVEIEGGVTVALNTDWMVGKPMMLADIGGKEVTVQVGWGGGVAFSNQQHRPLQLPYLQD